MPSPRETVKISARIPAEHYHAMLSMVQSADTPFTTTTDLLRHFIENGVTAMAAELSSDPMLIAAAAAVKTQRDIQRLDTYNRAEDYAHTLSAAVRAAEKSGDPVWAGQTREAALNFVNTTPYRSLADKLMQDL